MRAASNVRRPGKPEPKKVFHTLFVGSYGDEHPLRMAKKFPGRAYAAVDPEYGKAEPTHTQLMKRDKILHKGMRKEGWNLAANSEDIIRSGLFGRAEKSIFPFSKNAEAQRLRDAGITVFPAQIESVVQAMKKRGLRTKNISIVMPEVSMSKSYLPYLFSRISNVLVPNGKITIISEWGKFLEEAGKMAEEYGLSTSPIRESEGIRKGADGRSKMLSDNHKSLQDTPWNIDPKKLVITYGLKKARKDARFRRDSGYRNRVLGKRS